MTTAADSTKTFIGSGKLYFDRFDAAGNPTGLRFLGNARKLTITPSVDSVDVVDYTKNSRGVLASITKSQTHAIEFELMEVTGKNLALGMNGSSTAFTQTGGTVTDEVLASTTLAGKPQPVVDIILQTAQRNISVVTVKATTSTTPTTLVLGTDYEIEDASTGLIRILPGATLPGGVTGITASYTAAAVLSSAGKNRVAGSTVPQSTGRIVFLGDPVSGVAQDLEAWRVRIAPSAAIDMISDDPTNLTLSGTIQNDAVNHASEPYYRLTDR
ncbi:phage tail tube protein [Terriglobus albidus]|uniref:phage tail tube protein n=1 Tax=Terriglobus albidus TaxID=1592106 RepID=UPI0021DFF7EF|nr:hypothetical protein [Terriglobus albidus]